MRLRELAKGKRAVKAVTMRLANVPPEQAAPPGQAPPDDPSSELSSSYVKLGVRVMTGDETAEVYEKAQADAKEKGVEKWDDEHPLCRLYQMAHTLRVACVDIDDGETPFFESVREILSSPLVGTDNIAYLFEQQENWQDECSIQASHMGVDDVIALVLREAGKPENADSPLDLMRPGLRRSCFRTLANLFTNSLTGSSPTTSPSESNTTNDTSETDPTVSDEDEDAD